MAHSISFDDHGAYCKLFGNVTDKDYIQAIEQFATHENTNAFKFLIFDYLEIDTLSLTDDAATNGLALLLGAYYSNPSIKIAVVATNEDVVGMIRTRQANGLYLHVVRLFEDLIEAYFWAGILK